MQVLDNIDLLEDSDLAKQIKNQVIELIQQQFDTSGIVKNQYIAIKQYEEENTRLKNLLKEKKQ